MQAMKDQFEQQARGQRSLAALGRLDDNHMYLMLNGNHIPLMLMDDKGILEFEVSISTAHSS